MSEPIRWEAVDVKMNGGEVVRVKCRRVGRFMALRRMSAQNENEHTMFCVLHAPTGRFLAGFSSEAHAIQCAIDVENEAGDGLDSTDPEAVGAAIPEATRYALAFATDDDEWNAEE